MGVDVVKVMATGGNVTPGSKPHESQFGLEQLRVVVEAAHAAGLPVAAHAHGAAGVSDAVAARVDTIEHCSFMSEDGITEDPALMARLAVSGIPVSITAGSVPGPLPPKMVTLMPALLAHIRRLLDAGARCILSTDAGIGALKPHDLLPRSVTQAVELVDLPVAEALVMCTSRAADVIGVGNRAGRLRAGAPADVLVVAGDVARDPSALLTPLRVLRGGSEVLAGDHAGDTGQIARRITR
jgi:imidazolonepropionase-like amidohydrolase